jgi:hypothetical protein
MAIAIGYTIEAHWSRPAVEIQAWTRLATIELRKRQRPWNELIPELIADWDTRFRSSPLHGSPSSAWEEVDDCCEGDGFPGCPFRDVAKQSEQPGGALWDRLEAYNRDMEAFKASIAASKESGGFAAREVQRPARTSRPLTLAEIKARASSS